MEFCKLWNDFFQARHSIFLLSRKEANAANNFFEFENAYFTDLLI